MKLISKTFLAVAVLGTSVSLQAETTKDCLLKGTIQQSGEGAEQQVNVKFHSMERYDENANCRQRRGEKMEFKLPSDPRLKEAPDGTDVEYRYREDSDGSSNTQLMSVGA